MVETRWLSCIATVEWRSGARDLERPVALHLGHERIEVTVERSWVAGPPTAGEPVERVFVVRDPTSRQWRLRVRGRGSVRVEREAG